MPRTGTEARHAFLEKRIEQLAQDMKDVEAESVRQIEALKLQRDALVAELGPPARRGRTSDAGTQEEAAVGQGAREHAPRSKS